MLSEIKVLVVGGPSVGKSGQIFNFPLFHHVKVVYEWDEVSHMLLQFAEL